MKIVTFNVNGIRSRLHQIKQLIDMHRPDIIFLDEPTSGVDPLARREFWQRINALARQGVTVLVTTHFMEEADSMCNRVAIMHLGNVVTVGAPADLKASLGDENATLDDVFVHYAGNCLDSGGTFRDASRTRRTARRLG